MILGEILAEEIHETSGKILVEDNRDVAARPLSGPWQDPCQGRQRGCGQARICQDSTTVPMHLRGNVQPLDQLSKHLRGGMQIFVKTLPPHKLSSQPASVALHALVSLDARRNEARWRRTGRASLPSPIK